MAEERKYRLRVSEPEMKRIDWALGISIGLAEGYD